MNRPMNTLMTERARTRVGHLKSLLGCFLLLGVFIRGADCSFWNNLYSNVECSLHECCDAPHIKLDMAKLKESSNRVYGQHLVLRTIESHLEAHFDEKHIPPKPLVISFHGSTGTGKNYVMQFIVESIYKYGMKSNFVHYYHVSKRFPHQHRFEEYSWHLQKEIERAVSRCGRSIFIFDEFDHMPKGLIDQIKVYLDFHDNVEGVDYRKTMFFFLTNSGEELINDFTIDHHKRGRQRENIKLPDLEHHIARDAQGQVGGFHNSQLIDRHLVTAYVPFLPLLKRHVKMCIGVELSARGIKKAPASWVQEIMDELHFVDGFSESGCKRIREKVAFIMIKKRDEL